MNRKIFRPSTSSSNRMRICLYTVKAGSWAPNSFSWLYKKNAVPIIKLEMCSLIKSSEIVVWGLIG